MTVHQYISLILLTGMMFLPVGSAWAQTNDTITKDPDSVKTVTEPRDGTDTPVVNPDNSLDERDGRVLSSDQVKELVEPTTDVPTDLRPSRPEYRKIPPELELKLRDFHRLRERYLREQERLIKLYKGATAPERDLIRQRLQLRREEWLERSQNIKENSRERLRDLMRELPKHREALDAARDAARDQLQDVRRRGVDD